MIENMKIAVVIPAYRVATQIEGVIARMPESIDRIYVVDDASPDDVSARVRRLNNSRLELLHHEKNRGVGGATVTGMQAAINAGFDIVVKCDGDGQMEPGAIPQLILPLLDGSADYAKGSRFQHFRALSAMPKWRFFGNIGLTFLTKMASGYWNMLDPVNGFVAARAETLMSMDLAAVSSRYFFETDMLIRLNILEARVVDVPLPARYADEESALSIPRTLFGFPHKLLSGLMRRIFWRYVFYDVSPVAVFALLGALFGGFGVLFGSYHWIRNAMHGFPTPIGTVILAALPTILGFELLLQAVVLDIQNTPRRGGPPSRRIVRRSEPASHAFPVDRSDTHGKKPASYAQSTDH
jgi:glycosyltransferase involved in cell wall biosynthesis